MTTELQPFGIKESIEQRRAARAFRMLAAKSFGVDSCLMEAFVTAQVKSVLIFLKWLMFAVCYRLATPLT